MSNNEPHSQSTPGTGASGGFVPPTIEELNAALPSYEFVEMLGCGGMGAVFKARQPNLDRMVAIKILPLELGEEGLQFAERFKREAQALAKLNHPNIVSVYDFGQTDQGQFYFVMEFVEGTDLHQVIRSGQAGTDHVLGWVPQVCEALQYAHSKGIVHRDIKPANILIDLEGTVKVADFGLAKLAGDDTDQPQLTMTNMAMGTPDYVAPETLELGVTPDYRADIYAIGVMLYEMLTGKVPRGAYRTPSEKVPGLDSRYDDLVAKAMDADRDTRIQQATEISSKLWEIGNQPAAEALEAAGVASTAAVGKVKLLTGPVTTARASSLAAGTELGEKGAGSSINAEAAGASSAKLMVIGVAIAVLLVAGLMAFFLRGSGDDADIEMIVESDQSIGRDAETSVEPEPMIESKPVAVSKPEPAIEPSLQPQPTSEPGTVDAPPPSTSPAAVSASEDHADTGKVAGAIRKAVPEEGLSGPQSGNSMSADPTVTTTAAPDRTPPPLSEAAEKIAALYTKYENGYRSTMLAPHEAAVEKLNASYVGALGRERAKIAKSGDLDGVVAFRAEVARISEGRELPVGDEGLPESLAKLRQTYREQIGRMTAELQSKASGLVEPLNSELSRLEQAFTRSGKTDAALEIRQASIELASTGLPFVAFSTTEREEPEAVGAQDMREPALNTGHDEAEVLRVSADGKGGKLTLQKALEQAKPGQTLMLSEGVYPAGPLKDNEDKPSGFYEFGIPGLTLIGDRAVVKNVIVNADKIRLQGLRFDRLCVGRLGYINVERGRSVNDVVVDSCIFGSISVLGEDTSATVVNCIGSHDEGDSNTRTAVSKLRFEHCTMVAGAGRFDRTMPPPRMGGREADAVDCIFYSPYPALFSKGSEGSAVIRFKDSILWSTGPSLLSEQADNSTLRKNGFYGVSDEQIVDPKFDDPDDFPAGFQLQSSSPIRGKSEDGSDPGATLDRNGWPIVGEGGSTAFFTSSRNGPLAAVPPPLVKSPPAPVPVPAVASETNRRFGRLRAYSQVRDGNPEMDISAATDIVDLVDVKILKDGKWAAIRRDGTVISDDPALGNVRNAAEVFPDGGVLRRDGSFEIESDGEIRRYRDVAKFFLSFDVGAILHTDGSVKFWGSAFDNGISLPGGELSSVTHLVMPWNVKGGPRAYAVCADGRVVSWGNQSQASLLPEKLDGVVQLDSGWQHFLALTDDGKVHAWPESKRPGRVPDSLGKVIQIKANAAISAAQQEDLTWVAWGDPSMGVVEKANSLGPAIDLDLLANPGSAGYLLWIEPVASP